MSAGVPTSQEQREGKNRNADSGKWPNAERSAFQASCNPPSRAHRCSLVLLKEWHSPGEGSVHAAHGERHQKTCALAPHPGTGQGSQHAEGSSSCPEQEWHTAQPSPACSQAMALPLLGALAAPGCTAQVLRVPYPCGKSRAKTSTPD